MRVFAISDPHLSTTTDKPMDIFGGNWKGYEKIICDKWNELITEDDLVLIAGDISWGMTLQEALPDLKVLGDLPGKKVIIKGNHEYWWKSISSVRRILPESMFALQNDSIRFGNVLICGTRGWTVPEENKQLPPEDEKIYKREVLRLKLTLSDMQKQRKDGDVTICMFHYPPFNSTRKENEFTQLLEEYKIDKVVYGHLHGNQGKRDIHYVRKGIEYFLTSTDQINNTPVLIWE